MKLGAMKLGVDERAMNERGCNVEQGTIATMQPK
jgi:hypothetical protein